MTLNIAKTLRVLTIALLSIPCKSLATIRYVNISNPTPGAGTSWATAYNDLQSALAVAGTFDQIWIAQGIYKPSSPAGRSATFSNTTGASIYGGFNGTETAVTQANPTLYPTILSGDIGIAGNASDNCYHVLTYNANLWIGSVNGVTIRDGQADAGSSSVAEPDNTGGGVVFLAPSSGNGTGTYFSNCTFSNNYAFYGGAIGSYANTALQVNYNAYNCFFHDNQAVYGGAVFNTNVATDYLEIFENDIFYNNTASSGASVFGNAVTNGTSTELLYIQNCLFYNEAAPIFTNDFTNSAFSSLQCNYNIVWTSGTPYTSGYSAGNTPITMSSSDINGTIGSNMDADPLFVNAAAYDFHVSPCSPVIDKGPSYSPATTDIGGNARMQGSAVDIGPYETLKGTSATQPTVTTPVTFCQSSTATALTATGTNLLWYTTIGGASSTTAPTPVTTGVGTTDYYVTQTPAGSCESTPTTLTVMIKGAATAPTANPVSYCQNATAAQLTATGTNLLWYTTIGGASSTTAPTPVTTGVGTTDYYVTQTPAGSCESTPATIVVTIGSPANAPTANPVNYCQNVTAVPLTATGTNLLWYTTSTGGTGDPNSPTPSTTSTGTIPYYVSQTPAGSCESPRAEIDVTINPTPSADFTWSTPCEGKASAITATSNTAGQYTWDFGSDASVSGSGAGPIEVTWATSNTYTVTLTAANAGCQAQTQHLITVNPSPKVSIAAVALPLCLGNNVSLEATGASSYQWTPATLLSNPNTANPVVLLQNNIQYTVTGTDDNGCSATAQVTLDVSPDCIAYYLPDAFTPNGDGKNDEFRVKTADIPRSFTLMIFNRFGGKVFETTNVSSGWNGTLGGNAAPIGTYVYTMQATTSAGTIVKRQGTIILIR